MYKVSLQYNFLLYIQISDVYYEEKYNLYCRKVCDRKALVKTLSSDLNFYFKMPQVQKLNNRVCKI